MPTIRIPRVTNGDGIGHLLRDTFTYCGEYVGELVDPPADAPTDTKTCPDCIALARAIHGGHNGHPANCNGECGV